MAGKEVQVNTSQIWGHFFPGNHVTPEGRAKAGCRVGRCLGHRGWGGASTGLGAPPGSVPLGGPLERNTLSLWQLAEIDHLYELLIAA